MAKLQKLSDITLHAPLLKPNGTITSAIASGGIKYGAGSSKATAVYKKRRYMSERRRLYDRALAHPPKI